MVVTGGYGKYKQRYAFLPHLRADYLSISCFLLSATPKGKEDPTMPANTS